MEATTISFKRWTDTQTVAQTEWSTCFLNLKWWLEFEKQDYGKIVKLPHEIFATVCQIQVFFNTHLIKPRIHANEQIFINLELKHIKNSYKSSTFLGYVVICNISNFFYKLYYNKKT